MSIRGIHRCTWLLLLLIGFIQPWAWGQLPGDPMGYPPPHRTHATDCTAVTAFNTELCFESDQRTWWRCTSPAGNPAITGLTATNRCAPAEWIQIVQFADNLSTTVDPSLTTECAVAPYSLGSRWHNINTTESLWICLTNDVGETRWTLQALGVCNVPGSVACQDETGKIPPESIPEEHSHTLVTGSFNLGSCLREGQVMESTIDGLAHCECDGCTPVPTNALAPASLSMLVYGIDTGEGSCSTTAQYFAGPGNNMVATTSSFIDLPIAVPIIIREIRIRRSANLNAGLTETWTVQADQVDTAVTCNLLENTSLAVCLGFDVGIPVDQMMRLKRVCTGTDTAALIAVSVAYEPQ